MFTVEITAAGNENLHFFPLGRTLRGRFDASRIRGEGAAKLREQFEQPIPGMIVGFDGSKAWLIDPLYSPEHAGLRALLHRQGYALGPEREDFAAVDSATWAFWLRRAVDSGHARIISGELPEVIGMPKTSRISTATSRDGLIDKLINLLGQALNLPESKRQEIAASL